MDLNDFELRTERPRLLRFREADPGQLAEMQSPTENLSRQAALRKIDGRVL